MRSLLTVLFVLFVSSAHAQDTALESRCRCLAAAGSSLTIFAGISADTLVNTSCTCMPSGAPQVPIPPGSYVCQWGPLRDPADCSMIALFAPDRAATFCLCSFTDAAGIQTFSRVKRAKKQR